MEASWHTALNLAEIDVSAIESPDLGEYSLEPLAHQHCHTLTSSSRRKERDIAALLIKQVRQRSVLDEIRARFLGIDFAEARHVAIQYLSARPDGCFGSAKRPVVDALD